MSAGPSLQDQPSESTLNSVGHRKAFPRAEIRVSLLTGGFDRPYVFGLATALAAQGILVDVIGSDDVDRPEMHDPPKLNFLNLRGNQRPEASFRKRMVRISSYYARLILYALTAKPKIFHILWNNRFQIFDRTLLMLYYKVLGKKIVLTAHNVNTKKRDSSDSLLNRLTLKCQYRLADHIFVHTESMQGELSAEFGVRKEAITVIPFGINNSVPDTSLTAKQAKERLGLGEKDKVILFFGRIAPYKGLDYLASAFETIVQRDPNYRILIAGEPKEGAEAYCENVRETLRRSGNWNRAIVKIGYIPDEDTEIYFKAADVLALPYRQIYQSGVLFLAYSFGLPVIASDIGCFGADVAVGKTGFLSRPDDVHNLAQSIEMYFESDLYQHLDERRQGIRDFVNQSHSWDSVGEMTREVYSTLVR